MQVPNYLSFCDQCFISKEDPPLPIIDVFCFYLTGVEPGKHRALFGAHPEVATHLSLVTLIDTDTVFGCTNPSTNPEDWRVAILDSAVDTVPALLGPALMPQVYHCLQGGMPSWTPLEEQRWPDAWSAKERMEEARRVKKEKDSQEAAARRAMPKAKPKPTRKVGGRPKYPRKELVEEAILRLTKQYGRDLEPDEYDDLMQQYEAGHAPLVDAEGHLLPPEEEPAESPESDEPVVVGTGQRQRKPKRAAPPKEKDAPPPGALPTQPSQEIIPPPSPAEPAAVSSGAQPPPPSRGLRPGFVAPKRTAPPRQPGIPLTPTQPQPKPRPTLAEGIAKRLAEAEAQKKRPREE